MSLWKSLAGKFRRRSFSLNELDLKLKPYLDFKGGYFIEAGANNGLRQSNTLYFEKYLGWRGLLIEPIPDLAEQCRRNRPRCRVENCALVPPGFTDTHITMRYCNLMSLVKGAMKSEEEDLAHVRKGCEIQNVEAYELRVPARTLTAVLEDAPPSRIDLFSLDVEGFELSALQGLDFEKFRPAWLLVEARFRAEIDAFLAERGYAPEAELSVHDVLYRDARPRPAATGGFPP